MTKKHKNWRQKPPYWARQHADGEWVRGPLSPGSEEWGVILCRDRRMALRLNAAGPVLPVREPIDGEEHAVVIDGKVCQATPMAWAFGRLRRWREDGWLDRAAGEGEYQPSPEAVLGVGVLMLLTSGRSDAEVIAIHLAMPESPDREWLEDMVPQVRRWAKRQASLPCPRGLLDYLAHLNPASPELHARYGSALLEMAAGQRVDDAKAAGWVLRDAAYLARQMSGEDDR